MLVHHVTPKENANRQAAESARGGPYTPRLQRRTGELSASARWKLRDFRIVGTTSPRPSSVVQIRQRSMTGSVVLTGAVTAGAVAGLRTTSTSVTAAARS